MKNIILASKSRDRKEIFNSLKISFDVIEIDINEDKYKNKISNPIELVRQLARAKALAAKKILLTENKDSIIIAADTIVELNGTIIGKAADKKKAFEILTNLSGISHNLITGIAITELSTSKIISDYDITRVHFVNLSDKEIRDYIKMDEWKGRAGAYSIRERASLFIDSIDGSFSNVIGLPLNKLYEILKNQFKVNLLECKKQ